LRGVVKRAFKSQPNELDFGDSLVAGQAYTPRHLEVRCFQYCRSLEATLDARWGIASVTNPSGDGQHFIVNVKPNPALDVGVHNFNVVLRAVLRSGDQLPPVSVPVRAEVFEDLRILPTVANLGDMRVGDVRVETVSVTSRTGRQLRIVSCLPSSGDVTATSAGGTPSAKEHTNVFKVVFRASKVGLQAAEVRFSANYDENTSGILHQGITTATFKIRCYGIN